MRRDTDIADPGRRLGWPDMDHALGPRDTLSDVHDALSEVEVAATQGAHLAGAQPTPPGQEDGQTLPRRKVQELVEVGQ